MAQDIGECYYDLQESVSSLVEKYRYSSLNIVRFFDLQTKANALPRSWLSPHYAAYDGPSCFLSSGQGSQRHSMAQIQ